jgi:alpha-tubulin suppressor-like RCC1 family protein
MSMSPVRRLASALALAAAASGCGDEAQAPTAPAADVAVAAATTAVYTQVVVGGRHTCAIASNSQTYCWGTGPLGNATVSTSSKPVRVAGNLKFVQISAGTDHTCGVTAENRAYCWGDNFFGQVGDGTKQNYRMTPVAVGGGRLFRHIRAGGLHTCAINPFNKVFCWGEGSRGQLGDGTGLQRSLPTRVAGDLTIQRMIAGWQHTCAVTTSGKGYCWGRNEEGQLGTGNRTQSLKPVAIVGGLSFSQVVAGSDHTCGVTTLNKGYCWGALAEDYNGQLGSGGHIGSAVPVAVAGTRQWRQVNAGWLHSCGVTQANVAFCWGFNFYGQNGDGTNEVVVESPTRVAGNLSFVGVAVGVHDPPPFSTSDYAIHTCGITTDGRVFCWGWGSGGRLGNGTGGTGSLTPVQALPPT